MKKIALGSAMLLLLLSSGCVQSLPADKRLLCLDLTEKSYAFIPQCEEQEKCFSALHKSTFDFDESLLSPAVQSGLYRYKNDVAMSWLYFNRARRNIDEIHAACSYKKDVSILPAQLNELTHNLHQAFAFSDRANKQSFAVLLLEGDDLVEQDINSIKEEPLFNDYITINHNLTAFSSPATCQGESSGYACFYITEMQAVENLIARTGFSSRLVQETTAFDLLEGQKKTLQQYVDVTFQIPFLAQALPAFIPYLNDYFKLMGALDSLATFPAFQFLQAYNQFMGTGNSCLSRFSSIMKSDVLHRKELLQRNDELLSQINARIDSVQQSVNALLSRRYASFDANFFQELYAGLGQQSSIAAQRYSISDFSELNRKAEEELAGFKLELQRLQQLESLGMLSLGKKASALKELNNRLLLLQENIQFLAEEVVQGLLVLCNERASAISTELDDAELPSDYLLQAADLKARARFKLNLFQEAAATEEKLFRCRAMVDEFKRFSQALLDFQSYQLEEKTNLQECSSFLSTVFGSTQSSIDLSDFLLRYQQLQSLEKPYEDIAAVARLCNSLQSDVTMFLQQHSAVRSIEADFSACRDLLEGARLLNARDPSVLSDSSLDSLESQFGHFQDFFSGNSLLFEKAIPVLPELQQGLQQFVLSLGEKTEQAIASFVQRNAVISIEQSPDSSTIEIVSLTFSNPFRAIQKPLTLQVPFPNTVGSIIYSTPNVASLRSHSRELLVDLNCLPPGETKLSFSTAEIFEVKQSIELLSVSSDEALFKKTVAVHCLQPLPLVQIQATLIDSNELLFENISVYSSERQLDFLQQHNAVSFSLSDCSGKHTATVLFSVPKPVALTTHFLEENQLDENTTIYTYTIEATNKLPFELRNVEARLPVQFKESGTKGIELLAPDGKKLEFSMLPGKKIAFTLPLLLPMQGGKAFFLHIAVPRESDFQPAFFQDSNSSADAQANPGSSREAAKGVSQKISSFQSTVQSAEEKLALLESMFAAVSEHDLISAKYIPPITEAELNRLKLKLSSLKTILSKKTLQDFISLDEQGDFDAALLKSKQFEADLEEKQMQAEQIDSQLSNAVNTIKEDALASYNSAAALFNNSREGNKEAGEEVQKAQGALKSGDFLKAIGSAKNATALMTAANAASVPLDFPVLLVPIAIAVALVLFVRFKKEKMQRVRAGQVKRIASNW